ncbi:hypothetical protein BKA56DRAFT_671225 [Ilyonectria sp. MPI-CAGE-AT-0026]|nr:hypothetical protein BKA56DRAFT_671225 [Ilyonectria sp. MPI-CAGE-AT-0026]
MDDHLMSRDGGLAQVPDDHDAANPKPRACSNCARLKMKCQWPAAGAVRPEKTCARCARMKLECKVPEAAPRKKRGKSTRVAQLEKKLDGIVSLLAASQQMQAKGPSPLTPESPEAVQIPQPLPEKPASPFLALKETVDGRGGDDATSDSPELELLPGFRITHEQGDKYLDVYRRDFLPVFPFVSLPDYVTSRELYAHSEVLFWTIMAVVHPLPREVQTETKTWFRKYLAEHVVVLQERNLQMLQAILIHLAWNDFPFYLDPQGTPILQLALSLVMDLRLEKPPGSCGAPHKSLLGDAWSTIIKTSSYGAKLKTSHSLEEKRALLGYYHISSLLSVLFRRGTQLSWSNFLSQCCDALIKTDEYVTDRYLVAVVKMQHMTDRTYNMLRATDYYDNVSVVFRPPLEMAMNQARRELEAFVETQPESVKETKLFWSHYYILLVRLYEPVLQMKAPTLTDLDSLAGEPFQRAEAMWKCVQAASQFFNHQLTIPVAQLTVLPVTINGFLAFAIVTASRIMLLDSSPDWDPALARRHLDIADLLRRMSNEYEDADRVAQELGRRRRILDDNMSVFLKYSSKLRWIRQWYLSKIPQEPEVPVVEAPNWAVDFEFDENFWQELMSGYDCDDLNVSLPNAPVA